MKQVARALLCLIIAGSVPACALVTTLEHPAAIVRLSSDTPALNVSEVWFSPVDFFDEHSKDAKRVCMDKTWRASVDSSGVARFSERTRTTFLSFSNAESAMDRMMRGFAVCTERAGSGVSYLVTVGGGNLMTAAGATLTIGCRLSQEKWQCSKTIN